MLNFTDCDCKWQASWKIATKFVMKNKLTVDIVYKDGMQVNPKIHMGDRTYIFHLMESNPNKTMWWNSTKQIPGVSNDRIASGYDT